MSWLGKNFRSTEDVDPIVVSKDGKRECDENWGHAIVSNPISSGMKRVLTQSSSVRCGTVVLCQPL
jgi:hypothetical protein